MQNKNIRIVILILAFVIISESSILEFQDVPRENIEHYLQNADIINVDRDKEIGRTEPWIVSLDDGQKQCKGIFKYLDRCRPNFLPDSYKYDLAAYELDKLLDLNRVPPIVVREVEGVKGSLQILLEGCMRETERKRKSITPPDNADFQNNIEEIRIFDSLTNNKRSDGDDVWINPETWEVYRVDFSEAFDPDPGLPADFKVQTTCKKIYEAMSRVEDGQIKKKLSSYLNPEEIEALISRMNEMLSRFKVSQ